MLNYTILSLFSQILMLPHREVIGTNEEKMESILSGAFQNTIRARPLPFTTPGAWI